LGYPTNFNQRKGEMKTGKRRSLSRGKTKALAAVALRLLHYHLQGTWSSGVEKDHLVGKRENPSSVCVSLFL
jgi:hypothetical protein